MRIEPGLRATSEIVVGDDDTALALESGDVPVLATPRLVGLVERASVQAVMGALEPGTTSVGYRIQLDHLAPTAIGERVWAEALLEVVEGRRLTFRVTASDDRGLVGVGRVTRVLVDRARFLDKVANP
jgi:predicted thioesterase